MGDFNIAMETVLENEGGLVDDVSDPGGLTNFGISQRSYPNVDIRNLTKEGAKAIYLRDFWLFGGVISQPVCTKLMDSYVNMKHWAIKLAQRALAITEDGSFGPATLKAVNDLDPVTFLQRYRNELVDYYLRLVEENPAEAKYLKGWLNRARQ